MATCSCTPKTPIKRLCDDCKSKREIILNRRRVRKQRTGNADPTSLTISFESAQLFNDILDELAKNEDELINLELVLPPAVETYIEQVADNRRQLRDISNELQAEQIEAARSRTQNKVEAGSWFSKGLQ